MGPKPDHPKPGKLFAYPLRDHINLKHPLVTLADTIDWDRIHGVCSEPFLSGKGRPASSPRLIAGLPYLQYAFGLSDEDVVLGWVENPYWQFFTGEEYLQIKPPIDPSSLTRWRNRLGESGVEALLSVTLDTAVKSGHLKEKSMQTVIVDTTVMEKAISYPTDSRLLERSRIHLVKAASEYGLVLRQNYNRQAPSLARQICRYAHAKQFKRMHKSLRALKSRVGRVWRDIERQLDKVESGARVYLEALLSTTKRVLDQKPKDKNKCYALHAPEVECISKGKSRTPYEFGVKVSVTRTLKEGFVTGCRSMPGNPYDGHTLLEALDQASIISGRKIHTAIVDKGYRGVEIEAVRILRSGQRRGITRTLKKMIKKRSAVEATISHMKVLGKMGRNWLKGAQGDAIHAALCAAGHNIRLLIRKLWLFYGWILSLQKEAVFIGLFRNTATKS
jgi:IS5 family transposase